MNLNYFMETKVNIINNKELREPQVDAYIELHNHFEVQKKKTPAIIVLPTGSGKTGLMAIAPFYISKGRVLIIAPQLTILDTIESALDSGNARNFWMEREVISNSSQVPKLIVFEGRNSRKSIIEEANVIIANIQKLQKNNDASLINNYPSDFFDMIIIDEAHHSAAQTWIDTVKHFSSAKVVKITATPYRTDDKELVGDLVYKYRLSQAMAKKYVKSLEKFNYIPEQLMLKIPDNENEFTIDEILSMEGYSEDWIAKSVCFSDYCKERVIDESLKILSEKKRGTTVPHKIIAAAPNIDEAIKIANMYNAREGITAVAVHNELDKTDRARILNDIENNRIDVVVNVNMMGEGYDHKYLSIAAIFRVFKNILPYEQFIGRILRSIPESEMRKPSDNIGTVVVHKNLNLDGLWEYYRKQLEEWKFIEEISNSDDDNGDGTNSNINQNIVELAYGSAKEIGIGTLSHEIYMKTDYIKEKEQYEANRKEKIEKMLEIMPNMTPKEASIIFDSQETSDLLLNRPDKLIRQRQETTDKNIKFQIVPMLLAKHKLTYEGQEVSKLSVFNDRRYNWILKQKNNAAYLAIYFNTYLLNQIGLKRAEWSNDDFEKASKLLSAQVNFIDGLMEGL